LSEEIANLSDDRNQLRARWQSEKELVEKIQVTKKEIEQFRFEAEQADRSGDLGKVAEIRYGRIPEAENNITELKQKLMELQGDKPLINEEVGAEDIAQVVSKITGIPLFRLEEKESKRLLRMEDELRKRVVGQDEAIGVLAKSIRRARAGLGDPRRPIGSFIFLGPTGVGKTELARTLAEFLFEDADSLIRIDMSEYMEKFAVSRLIGAPPGYVGYEEGGQLTEKVRRRPYSVVLLDEIEKAHPDVFNILLQLMDDGSLTDSFGRKVDFRNTVVILTSNVGTRMIKDGKTVGFGAEQIDSSHEVMKRKVSDELKRLFNPELLNRIDESIIFRALTIDHIKQIVDILLVDIAKRLADKGISFQLTEEGRNFLANAGFEPMLGARPLKRALQKYLEDPLAEELLRGQYAGDCNLLISADEEKLTFTFKDKESKNRPAEQKVPN